MRELQQHPSTPKAIVAGRIVLLMAAAAAVLIGLGAGRQQAVAPDAATAAAVTYVCPMHPEVTSPAPGDCPICRMALAPKETRSADDAASASVSVPSLPEMRAFDAVSKTKRYETALEMRAPAWAEDAHTLSAVFHLDERDVLRPGETGLFFPSGRPRDGAPPGIAVRLDEAPSVPWDRATALVRFRTADGRALAPGQTGTIKLASRVRNDLVVRASAVLRSPEGPYVLVASDDRRTFTKRPVELGNIIYGYAAVIGGLREGELVAAAHTFSLDAERRQGGSVAR